MKYYLTTVVALLLLGAILFLAGCQPLPNSSNAEVQVESAIASLERNALREFYIDSTSGDDQNSGTSEDAPWKSLDKVSSIIFLPGDHINFKRCSSFAGGVTINGDGTAEHPIVIGAYGSGEAPRFTNADRNKNNGNAMRIQGDHHIVENLYFHHTAAARPGASFLEVWESGALHVALGFDHVIIRNNEFAYNAKAIHSYSEHSLITHNFIHDTNELDYKGFLSQPYWGPIGIHLGIGNQEISYNIIENMYVEGGEWGGDGGAIEIDDGRNHKDNIHIHHNQTLHNMGFLEISWAHDMGRMPASNMVIEYNVSRDYQDFVLWWADNSESRISNNTIIRTDALAGMAFDTVFFLEGKDIAIHENIVVTRDDMWAPVFEGEDKDSSVHTNNLYWDMDDGIVLLGMAPGTGEFTADPQFIDFDDGDYRLKPGSPAVGFGALSDGPIADVESLIANGLLNANFELEVDDDKPRNATLATASETSDWIKLEDTDPRLGINGGDTWYAPQNSDGTTRTMWEQGDSLTVLFEGSQIRFYGLKSDYMVTANIWIDGKLVAANVSCRGNDHFQALLWESDVLEHGTHQAEIVSNGDTVEVDFIEYR
ncbi:MAG: hypothetical protein AAF702_46440 [Chloroflexota bacterium]